MFFSLEDRMSRGASDLGVRAGLVLSLLVWAWGYVRRPILSCFPLCVRLLLGTKRVACKCLIGLFPWEPSIVKEFLKEVKRLSSIDN